MSDKIDYVQFMFALSPFPAYLPQYFTMMQQLAPSPPADSSSSSNGNGNGNNVGHSDSDDNPHDAAELHMSTSAADREGGSGADLFHHLRKRNLHDHDHSPGSMMMAATATAIIASPPNAATTTTTTNGTIIAGANNNMIGALPGTPSKSFEHANNNGDNGRNSNKFDTGLSRATVLLLLSAHLLRLLYFHGILLEEDRPVPPRAGAGMERDKLIAPTEERSELIYGSSPSESKPSSALQWDLLGQSLSMIVVQLMLLHVMMLLRRKKLKRAPRKRTSDLIAGHGSAESLVVSQSILTLRNGGMNNNSSNNSSSPSSPASSRRSSSSSINTISFWKTIWKQFARGLSAHFYHLFSPHNILHEHSFLKYLELLFVSSMAVKLVFDYHWYPRYRMEVVEGLKRTSIVLESCLALPQAIRNYRKGTTEGLSFVMVGGWVAGDFFKLCYFSCNMIGGVGPDGNAVFVIGCIFAISLDSIVGMQMVWWFPHTEAIQWRKRIQSSARHWKANKDDDAGESLLVNPVVNNTSIGKKRGGLLVSFLREFYRWARGIRPCSRNAS